MMAGAFRPGRPGGQRRHDLRLFRGLAQLRAQCRPGRDRVTVIGPKRCRLFWLSSCESLEIIPPAQYRAVQLQRGHPCPTRSCPTVLSARLPSRSRPGAKLRIGRMQVRQRFEVPRLASFMGPVDLVRAMVRAVLPSICATEGRSAGSARKNASPAWRGSSNSCAVPDSVKRTKYSFGRSTAKRSAAPRSVRGRAAYIDVVFHGVPAGQRPEMGREGGCCPDVSRRGRGNTSP